MLDYLVTLEEVIQADSEDEAAKAFIEQCRLGDFSELDCGVMQISSKEGEE